MESSSALSGRLEALNEAIGHVLSKTLSSATAGANLEKAFPNYNFAKEMGTTDNILASLTKIATESALTRVNETLSQSTAKHAMNALDQQYIGQLPPQNDENSEHTPDLHMPQAALNDVNISCKRRELEKLKGNLAQKEKVMANLQKQVSSQERDGATLRYKLDVFSQNADEIFQLASNETA